MKTLLFIILLSGVGTVNGEELIEFNTGDIIEAESINQNFKSLKAHFNYLTALISNLEKNIKDNSGIEADIEADIEANTDFRNSQENIATVFLSYEKKDTDGVVGISCPDNMIALSLGCSCDITTTGEIFSLRIIGNGALCGCGLRPNDDDYNYDVVTVQVNCLSVSEKNQKVRSLIEEKAKLQKAENELKWMREEMEQAVNK